MQEDFLRKEGVDILSATVSFPSRKKIWVFFKYSLLLARALKFIFHPLDVIHVHYLFPPGIIGLLLKYLKKAPLVVTAHGGDINDMAERNPVNKLLTCLILKKADAVVSVSRDIKEKILTRYRIPENRIKVVDMGVDREIFHPIEPPPPKKPYLLFVGRLEKIKGPDIAVKAISLLPSDFHLFIVGEGEEKEKLKNLAGSEGVKERVHFLGGVPPDTLPSLFHTSFLTLIPSREEPFGLVGLESMSCGTPVLASGKGGLGEYIKDGINGFLLPSPEPSVWAEKIWQLWELSLSPRWNEIIREGYRTAEEHSAARKSRVIQEIYYSLLKGGKR